MRRQLWTVLFSLAVFGCAAETSEPSHRHAEDDRARVQTLSPGATATFEQEAPFRRVGLLIDTLATDVQIRGADGQWRPVEITWSEGVHKVARVVLDEPVTRVELRANEPWSFGTIQFYDDVVAADTLTRDLPAEEFDASPAGLAPADLVISRAQWGARSPNKVCGSPHNPYRMAIHHTAVPADDGGDAAARMRQMQAYHIDSNGWCDIGYHFVVSQGGQIFQGRSDEQRSGAHVGSQNNGNIGICLIGNFENQQVNDNQFAKAAEIVGWVGRTYDIPFNRSSIRGHREHAGQSTSCPGSNLVNRLDELVTRASGPVTPPAPHAVDFEVTYQGELTDFYQAGSSAGIPDFFAGDTLQAVIRFKNTTSGPLRNVQLGYWFESPHLAATNYTIESDAPGFDGATFMTNDANDNPDNPAKAEMGTDGTLGLYAMGAGETKRVVIDLEVGDYSIGAADHPDVRGWVRHVDDLYGEQSSFNMDPTNANAFEALLQGFAQLDVLSRDEWQFDAGEAEQTEGWFGCSGVSPVVDVEAGALTADVGPEDCFEAPAWTLIDADTWDQLVLRMQVDGSHEAAIYWAADGEQFSEERAVAFKVDESTSTYVVPVGLNDAWLGDVARLRVTPSLDGSTLAAIDAVFVQSSTGEVGSARDAFVPDEPVSIGEEVVPPTMEDNDPPQVDEFDPRMHAQDEFRVNKGCATVASGSGSAVQLLWLLGFVLVIRRRRR